MHQWWSVSVGENSLTCHFSSLYFHQVILEHLFFVWNILFSHKKTSKRIGAENPVHETKKKGITNTQLKLCNERAKRTCFCSISFSAQFYSYSVMLLFSFPSSHCFCSCFFFLRFLANIYIYRIQLYFSSLSRLAHCLDTTKFNVSFSICEFTLLYCVRNSSLRFY